MGLALAQGIASLHRGLIRYLPPGGQFAWLVPLDQPQKASKHLTPSNTFVLLVDDEEMVAEGTALALQSLGYQVHAVTNPQEALHWLQNNEVKPDLLLTDFAMGSVTGLELARQVRSLLPKLPIVIFSGYTDAALWHEATQAGVSAILTKPLTEEDLQTCLAELL